MNNSRAFLSLGRRVFRFTRKKPLGAVSAGVILIAGFAALFASFLAPFDPDTQDLDQVMTSPSLRNLCGTDQIGRDILSRIIYGARISLLVALSSTALGVAIGVLVGLISGYYRGRVDLILQNAMDCLMAFPTIVLALAIMSVLGTSLVNVIFSIAIVFSPRMGRVIRGSVLAVKEEDYITASRALGCSSLRIIFFHILPNVMVAIVVMATINLGQAIIVEAALSFLGLGVPPPAPSWGSMLSGSGKQYMIQAPWLAIFPGVAIAVMVLSFNLLGDALRDVLDPRMKKAAFKGLGGKRLP